MNKIYKLLLGSLLLGIVFMGCDKTKLYKVKEPDGQATFLNLASGTYWLLGYREMNFLKA